MPNRVENTSVELVKDTSQDSGKIEGAQTEDETGLLQVPGQLTGPVSASASHWSESALAPPNM